MNLSELIGIILGLAAAGGGLVAYYNKSRGKETITLLQTNVEAYKDSERLKDQKIALLEVQLKAKDEVIAIRDETIKRILSK